VFCPACGKEIPDASVFCLACGEPTAVQPTPQPVLVQPKRSSTIRRVAFGFVGLLALYGVVMVVTNLTGHASPSAQALYPNYRQPIPTYVPHIDKLISGQNVVKAGSMYWVSFKVNTAQMMNVRVVGRFTVTGGSGNDIEAILTDEDDFENWKNGHPARALYSSGKTTVGNIDFAVPTTGTYYLGFNNRFSTFAGKFLDGNVELRYTARPVANSQ
jgi:zinc-ribbon domain